MVSITLSVPEDVKRKMEKFPEINWSGFVRKAIVEKTQELIWKEEMLRKLKEEEPITAWSLALQRTARNKRYEQLKRKGLV